MGRLVSSRLWGATGAIVCGFAVIAGAYGWHSLESDHDMRQIFMLGVQYHMWHGLALLVVAWLADGGGRSATAAAAAGLGFLAGIVLFSVNLYVLAVTGEPLISGAAPIGGFALMGGWAILAVSAILRKPA